MNTAAAAKKTQTAALTVSYLGVDYSSPTKQVKNVQRILRQLGYKGKDGKALTVDGVFGANTEYAVKAFQKYCKATADGIVGAVTWKLLTGGK